MGRTSRFLLTERNRRGDTEGTEAQRCRGSEAERGRGREREREREAEAERQRDRG